MDAKTTIRLARAQVRNAAQRRRFLRDGTAPARYANAVLVLDMLCNSACGMCSAWSKRTLPGTLDADQWCAVIDQLHAHNPDIKLSFVGGEPLMVDGLSRILQHASDLGMMFSIVTNGILLDEQRARELLDVRPLAVHVSLDSLQPDVYKRIRGVDATEQVQSNIARFAELRRERQKPGHFGLKTTVTRPNVAELGELADFAETVGASIHYQPVLDDNKVARRMMQVDLEAIDFQVETLARRAARASHIVNSASVIRMWSRYFREQETERQHCPTSLENLFILRTGEIRLCERYDDTIGNVLESPLPELLVSSAAQALREKTVSCGRNCSFIYKRSWADTFRLFLTMVRPRRTRRRGDRTLDTAPPTSTASRSTPGGCAGGGSGISNGVAPDGRLPLPLAPR